MKIACIGNMNNTMFCIARYLRDEGFDVDVLLVEEFSHFSCLSDAYNDDSKNYTHQLDWYEVGHWAISKDKIKNDLKKYDFLIGSDLAPAFVQKAGLKLDIFVPHGGDIYFHTIYKLKGVLPKKYEVGAKYRSHQQRQGIKNAHCTLYDYIDEKYLKIENKFVPIKKRIFSPSPHLYYKQYYTPEFAEQKKTTIYFEKIKELRNKYDFIVLNHNRLNWTKPEYGPHLKGSDVLIKGFAKFVQSTKSNSLLILFEYGMDINETKELVNKLGIENNVQWFEISERKNIMPVLEQADVVCGNFYASAMTYGCSMEALCMKKPLLAFRIDSLYTKTYNEIYPLINASNDNEVCEKLTYYSTHKDELVDIGKKGHEWFLKYLIKKPIDIIVSKIKEKSLKLEKQIG